MGQSNGEDYWTLLLEYDAMEQAGDGDTDAAEMLLWRMGEAWERLTPEGRAEARRRSSDLNRKRRAELAKGDER